MSTPTLDKPDVTTKLEEEVLPYDDSDADETNLTHIINPPDNQHIRRWSGIRGMQAQDIVDVARANQWPVNTLCGKSFVPKRNPEKYPACQPCIDKAGEIMRESGE